MIKKARQGAGLRVRSQLKAGFDKCGKCKLGCSLMGDMEGNLKQKVCYDMCNYYLC